MTRLAWAGRAVALIAILLLIGLAVARRPDQPSYPPVDFAVLKAVEACSRSDFSDDEAFARCRYDRAQERLALVRDPRLRAHYLGDVAVTSLDAGLLDEARRRATEARALVADMAGERLPVQTSDAEEKAAIVEGRLALAAGDTATARARLIDAGSVLASPTQTSFGPNVTLARDLLAAGDTASVRAYFDTLSRTWPAESSAERLRQWRAALDRGETPDFSANLVY